MILAAASSGAHGVSTSWTGASQDWSSANWSAGEPGSNDNAYVNTGNPQVTSTGETAENLYPGEAPGTTGSVTVTSGSLSLTNQMILGNSGTGLFYQTSGTVSVGQLLIGNNADGEGTYSLAGSGQATFGGAVVGLDGKGTLLVSGSGVVSVGELTMAQNAGSSGTVSLSGGKLRVVGTLGKGSGTGTFVFDGGTLAADTVGFSFTNAGGVLAPGDSPGTTTINGDYTQDSTGTLEIEINGYDQGDQSPKDGVGYDFVDVVTGNASLAGYVDVVLLDDFLPEMGDTFDVLEATGTVTIGPGGLEIHSPSSYLFAYSIVEVTGGQALRLTATPEPATMAMLAMAFTSLGAYIRRRRRI